MEGDLRAVGAEHGVPAASDPEGVQAVRVQVTHHSAGTVHLVCSPPAPTVLTVLLGRGLVRAPESGERSVHSKHFDRENLAHLWSVHSLFTVVCVRAQTCGTQACGDL